LWTAGGEVGYVCVDRGEPVSSSDLGPAFGVSTKIRPTLARLLYRLPSKKPFKLRILSRSFFR
jgi:hypothetical protein